MIGHGQTIERAPEGHYRLKSRFGRIVLFDEQDYGLVTSHIWGLHTSWKVTYAVKREPDGWRRVGFSMHRAMLGFPALPVDHLNGDGLDNRRCNIRVSTNSENAHNTDVVFGASGIRGVRKSLNRWRAIISLDGKPTYCGVYDTKEEAQIAYLRAMKAHYGYVAPRIAVPPNFDNLPLVNPSKKHANGQGIWSARLTPDQVRQIRASSARHCDLAKQFNTVEGNIRRIRRNESWTHIL